MFELDKRPSVLKKLIQGNNRQKFIVKSIHMIIGGRPAKDIAKSIKTDNVMYLIGFTDTDINVEPSQISSLESILMKDILARRMFVIGPDGLDRFGFFRFI